MALNCLNPLNLLILILGSLIEISQTEVSFEFGHFLEPELSRTDNLTVLANKSIKAMFRCQASYPTEWVLDQDDVSERSHQKGFRWEWTDRKFANSIDEPVYNYIAWLYLGYGNVRLEERFLCRAVSNHEDNILIKFRPIGEEVHITHHPKVPENEAFIEPKPPFNVSNPCPVEMLFMSRQNGYFWRCQLKDGTKGSLKFHDCPYSTAYCANTFRELKKLPSCVKIVTDPTIDVSDWERRSNDNFQIPQVAVCSADESAGIDRKRAIEYFFSGINFDKTKRPLPRKIHFSWNEINPEEMIWMDPVKDIYYTTESLTTRCTVPKYGFSFDPVLDIGLNGSRLRLERDYKEVDDEGRIWRKDVEIDFGDASNGPGTYIIHCIGPVWNSTEWANKTKAITVKNPTAPYFDVTTEKVTYQDGDTNKSISCHPKGDPQPSVSWESPLLPGTKISGNQFIFGKVTETFTNGNFIKCVATNEFGQKAVKEFEIHVEISASGVGSTTIIIIIVVIIFALILIGGLLFLYFKFLKLGSQIATYLTYEEVKEFKHGKQKADTTAAGGGSKGRSTTHDYENEGAGGNGGDEEDQPIAIECLPYNSEFEVSKDNLSVDFNGVLGSGEYGIVYNGTIKLNPRDQNPMQVAVKTVKKNVHINYFKALMSELKILAYIGHHENIVNLIGACTSNIKNRELYVGVELCKTSLLKFLQDNRNNFQNFVVKGGVLTNETSLVDSTSTYQNTTLTENRKAITTFDLIQWAAEIAAGMEFLCKKKVIHGDLATRNILLSFELHAKICDFGLARQLIDYNYIKSSQCPLPWKWMAIESLSQMKFSTNSDVWSYGVTLWEIFSLGNVPYPGMAWNMDFVEQLISGLRMGKPAYASDLIYNTMIECWRENPKERPKFSKLKEFFQSLEVN